MAPGRAVRGSVWVRRPGSALMQPAELPRLTPQAAIERSWHVPEGGRLLEPDQPAYLTTLPLPPRPLPRWWWWGPERVTF